MRAIPVAAARRNFIALRRLPTTFLLATAAATRSFPVVCSLASIGAPQPPSGSKRSSNSAATTMTAKNNVISFEGKPAIATDTGSKEFLLSNPSGAYTTARTCGDGSRIFEWEAHVERTASSLASMMEKEIAKKTAETSHVPSRLTDPSVLRRRLDASVEGAVRLHKEINGDGGELKITALVGWRRAAPEDCDSNDNDGDDDWVACHVTGLPPLPTRPVRVEVRGSPRENAAAKDSSWVSDRAPLEALMAEAEVAPINELLLSNGENEILEGSQTNFYAVIDGAVHTAEDGILAGTVRGLVLDVCRREGIPVVLHPPNLSKLDSWEGALLSSTSRLALPIDELYIPSEGRASRKVDLRVEFENGAESVAERIQKLVSMEVEARSTPIGELSPV